MPSGIEMPVKNPPLVGMGQVALGRAPELLCSVLGSCVGVVIYHPRMKMAALAHVVLAEAAGREGPPGKFADTAIPFMVQMLSNENVPRSGLVAKLAGGSEMFAAKGAMQIGGANARAVAEALEAARIRILATDLGSTKGRRITFDCETGDLQVEVAGNPTKTI